ncbi:sulfate ABC transporter permease subunit CysT [Alicyclobacillus cycloheptanicus]|uniref:Sulfate transport system permease protein CysT n=1 Tax=Alicyclobacillus cycloheptanicus TaxID=1457 RepID=A0ABT9XH04_9BACL|nr:sulfate ABC transporter permease subunit CysT [Alicyclobacillus cycloheptanicus]MDQ0189582.1 sulfate transport system permease protein [Alicyclobacillus cycloheptanicus]
MRQPSSRATLLSASGYLLLLIVLPIGAVFQQAFSQGAGAFFSALAQPIGVAALRLTVETALVTAAINAVAGSITAYALTRTRLPGRTLLNAMVDLPFAIPTTVSGLMLVFLYGPTSPIGQWFTNHGIRVIYSPIAIVLAMVLVTFPYAVRTIQPLLEDLDVRMEEAAATLGAGPARIFRTIVFPVMWPGVLSGFTLGFSRALAEFGAVVIVAGNLPMKTQVSSYYLYGLLENYDQQGAAAVSVLLLAVSFVALYVEFRVLHRQPRFRKSKDAAVDAPLHWGSGVKA